MDLTFTRPVPHKEHTIGKVATKLLNFLCLPTPTYLPTYLPVSLHLLHQLSEHLLPLHLAPLCQGPLADDQLKEAPRPVEVRLIRSGKPPGQLTRAVRRIPSRCQKRGSIPKAV